jgi:trehalose/maltose transport system permease protein
MRRYAKIAGLYAGVAAIVLYTVFPFYYAIIVSMQRGSKVFEVGLFPLGLDFQNYRGLMEREPPFSTHVWNSVLVAVGVVMISLALATVASYVLARVHFRGRALLLFTILAVSMFPQVAVLSGMFEVISALGLTNSLWSLVFSYMLFTLPFTVWVLTTFMRDLPRELEEAAIVDGATPWQIITRVFMPLMWPALITTGLLAFIAAWNEFLFALTFVTIDEMRTVPVAIANFSGSDTTAGMSFETPWGNIMAASVLVTLPIVIAVMIFQRRIIAGLTDGALKG